MPRCNGSYIGVDANPNANVASGIWTVREAETYLRANKWPATPTVPGAPTGEAGDGQVSLTWTAPTGGSAVTDYEVQYSSNGGSTWTTFSDGVSTSTSATVTGLTNGAGYIFRVRALNALGEGPYGSASGTVTPGLLANLLLHFDGANGSTAFTDSSGNNLAVTANGNAQISTAQSKLGGASGYFDGSGAYIEVASSDGQDFGTGDFTIEMWLRCESAPTYLVVSGEGPSGNQQNFRTTGWNIRRFGGALQLERFDGQSEAIVAFGQWSPPNNEWIHLAISRESGTSRAFVDGTLLSAQADSVSWSRVDNTETLLVGHAIDGNGPSFFAGYIDELRIVKGIALYTANFTPPA